ARAKAKAAQTEAKGELSGTAVPSPAASAPRDLQERLNQEFRAVEETPSQAKQPDVQAAKNEPGQDNNDRASQPAKAKEASSDDASTEKLSVPEKLAAASGETVKQNAEAAQQASNTAAEQAPKPVGKAASSDRKIAMAIREAHAYFQPGIHVGGPAIDPRLETSATRAHATLHQTIAAASAQPDVVETIGPPPESSAPLTAKTPQLKTPSLSDNAEASSTPADPDDVAAPDPETVTDANSPRVASAGRRKKKSFLKRTVIPYPTHFWPKSWVRALERRKQSRLAAQSTTPATEAAE
ncbi:MAG: hypothetical protein ACX939_01355, partial [Hyphococcus sp.]